MLTLLAIVGLCYLFSKLSKGLTRIGNILEALGDKLTNHDYKRNYPHPEDLEERKKHFKKARKEIIDADYNNHIEKQIDELTK
jgi:hypothetical protein